MIFKSAHPDISWPKDQSLWHWLFESGEAYKPPSPSHHVEGYTNVVTKQHISYTDVKQFSEYLSTALVSRYGLQPGDSVIIYSRNSVYFPVAGLATIRSGAMGCGTSPDYNSEELAHSLRVSKAKFIFAGEDILDNAFEAAAKVGLPKENIFLVDGQKGNMKNIQQLIDEGRALGPAAQVPAWTLPAGKSNRDVCAFLAFSSGTTGLPKAIMISHANIIAQAVQTKQVTPLDRVAGLAALPFYHITGIVHQFMFPIMINLHVYVVPKFQLDVVMKAVQDYKIPELLLVPPVLIAIVRNPKLIAGYDLSHVKRFASGAAPLSQEILTALEKMFPGTGFKQGYGMTESCSMITGHPIDKAQYKYASKVGTLVGSTELRIVDPDTGKDCGINEPGELWARGPQITMGYLDNAKATADTFDKDGFLHTGDIGTIDEEGMVTITDRIKDMIKVKGIGVAPAELEDLLLGHDLVEDAAVCGILDDRAGERPKAFVALKAGIPQTPEAAGAALLDYVRSNKTRHKWIAEMEIVHAVPKSAAGKILRRKLRDSTGDNSIAIVREDIFKAKL